MIFYFIFCDYTVKLKSKEITFLNIIRKKGNKKLNMKSKEKDQLNSLDYSERGFIGKGQNYLIHEVEGFETLYSRLHEHNFSEVFCLLEGDITYVIEEGRFPLRQYDCLFIPPHTLHQLIINDKTKKYKRIVLWIYTRFLDEISSEFTNLNEQLWKFTSDGNYLIRDLDFSIEFKNHLQKIIKLQEEKPYGYDLLIQNEIRVIFISLSRYLLEQDIGKVKPQGNPIVIKTINYIDQHMQSELKLDELASQAGVDVYYLSHLFTKEVGITIHQYIVKKRLNSAKKMLDENKSIKDIATSVGFKDVSHFIQVFKKEYGITPNKYKQSFNKNR